MADRTILFAWELGANFGHAKPLARLIEVARDSLSDARLVFAAADLFRARQAIGSTEVTLVQAPVWPAHSHTGTSFGAASYLDTLALVGFASPEKLSAIVDGWLSLLDVFRPAVIVADHAPGLLVAARIRGIPVIAVGSCGTLPPVEYDRFPPIRADRGPLVSEQRALSSVASIMRRHGAQPPASLIALFRTAARVVFGCPELDVYSTFRKEPVFQPPEGLPVYVPPPIEPRIFVYLGGETQNVEVLLQALLSLKVPLECFLRDNLEPLRRLLVAAGHISHDAPPNLTERLPMVSHVIYEGGAYTSHALLAAGRPALALPYQAEAAQNVDRLSRLGLCWRFQVPRDEKQVSMKLDDFIRDHSLQASARDWSLKLALRPQPDGLKAFAEALHRLAGVVG